MCLVLRLQVFEAYPSIISFIWAFFHQKQQFQNPTFWMIAYLYTLESYDRHKKIPISQNPSKSAVRDYDQMKNMPKAAKVVHELLR